MTTPVVSVVLPTFDRVAFLRAAVDSVLRQSFTSWELLVADDGSTDGTADFLRGVADARVRTLRLPHSGNPSRVRNAAIREARGAYLAFLDSDDLWTESKLEAQLGALGARPRCRWSYTAAERIDEAGRSVPDAVAFIPHEGTIVEPLLTIAAYVALPTVLAERALVEQVGAFDEQQWFGEDYDLWLRLAARSEVAVVTERLARVRLHAHNYSHDRPGFYEGWLRLYEKAAAATEDPRLRAICRRKRAELGLALAHLHGDAGHRAAALRALARAWPEARADPRWWLGATKVVGKSMLPSRLLGAYRRRRGRAPGAIPGAG